MTIDQSLTMPFKDLLPPLSTQEREALYASIELEGVRDPVVVDELGQVLDGHHRLAIAPDAPCRVVSGLTDAEKRAYVYQVNFARRNLSPNQKRERTKRMKEVAVALRKEDPVKNTQERVGALLGVTQGTVSQWLKNIQSNRRSPRADSTEANFQRQIASEVNGQCEFRTPSGAYADIVTQDKVYEVKDIRSWKQAIGQSITYASELDLSPAIVLFGTDPKESKRGQIEAAARQHGVEVIWRTTPKPEPLPGRLIADWKQGKPLTKTQCRILRDLGFDLQNPPQASDHLIGINNVIESRVKIPPKQKPVILERVETGETQEQVAADYGVTQAAISLIVNAERKAQDKKREREEKIAQIGDVGIQHGDFREIGANIADASVDFILTDPPYDKKHIPLYGDLAALAARVLRPGGWCLAYCGQTWLVEYLRLMSEHLTYGWMFAIHHTGGDLRYRKLKLQGKWKPVLGFYKPPLDAWWDWFPDLATGGREKAEHSWQQATAEAIHYIKALCPANGVVLDPMVGSGTVCVAAILTKRQWIGFEKNKETADTAQARVHEALEALS